MEVEEGKVEKRSKGRKVNSQKGKRSKKERCQANEKL